MRKKVTVVGAGNVGANCALRIADKELAEMSIDPLGPANFGIISLDEIRLSANDRHSYHKNMLSLKAHQCLVLSVLLAAPVLCLGQGSLTPPGSPVRR